MAVGTPTGVVCTSLESARVRVAVSPLATAAASLYEVVGGWLRGSDPKWVAAMRRRAAGIDLRPLAVFATESRVVLDPLLPLPPEERPIPTFGEELSVVAAVSEETIRAEIAREFGEDVPPEYGPWTEDPAKALAGFVRSLGAWWDAVVAPEWPRMAAMLETELLRIGRRMALGGRAGAMAAIHPRIRLENGVLVLPPGQWSPTDTLEVSDICLMPMACGPDGLLLTANPMEGLVVAYGAPGAASQLRADAEPRPEALSAMLGSGRARTLRALESSSSIKTVAGAVGLSTSTVCTHLHALAQMELVSSSRVGRYVMYSRTPRGEQLVQLF